MAKIQNEDEKIMNALLDNRVIEELSCGTNFAYVLNDSSQFLLTDYKVLQSHKSSDFVKCMKMTYNGKMAFYYMTGEVKTLMSMFPALNADTLTTIVTNLFAAIIEVKSNGFLSCQNIDISFNKIYVDEKTLKVSLVYIPVRQKMFEDYGTFENALRTNLVRLINTLPALANERAMRLATALSNGTYTLEDLYRRIKGTAPSGSTKVVTQSDNRQKQIKIRALNAPAPLEITVNKESFLIGKNAAIVDGVISYNSAVSRKHCKITKDGEHYFVTDLGSVNGTFINGKRIFPNQACPLKDGDTLRLANSDFRISVK